MKNFKTTTHKFYFKKEFSVIININRLVNKRVCYEMVSQFTYRLKTSYLLNKSTFFDKVLIIEEDALITYTDFLTFL